MSVLPIAIAFGAALVAFAVAVPWLVRESRRPLRVPAPSAVRDPEHPVLSSLVICTQSLLVSILPRHTTPDLADAAETWRTSFSQARRCEAHPRSEAFTPAAPATPPRGRNLRGSKPTKAELLRAGGR